MQTEMSETVICEVDIYRGTYNIFHVPVIRICLCLWRNNQQLKADSLYDAVLKYSVHVSTEYQKEKIVVSFQSW